VRQRDSEKRVRVTIFGQSPRLARVAQGYAQMSHGVASLIEFQVQVHRRDAEDTEVAQRPDSRTLRRLCVLGAPAVKWRLQNEIRPKS
jgi:hypothetical protein